MARECELLSSCGFFKTHQGDNDLACKGFINQYCRGPHMDKCKRKQYRAEHGAPPPDNMMPNGQILSAR